MLSYFNSNTGLPFKINVAPEDDQLIENGNEATYTVDIVDQSDNPTSAPKMSAVCKVFLLL